MGAGSTPRSEKELLTRFDARFRGPLMSFFLRRVGSRTDAEDLTHDVFIRLAGVVQREGVDDPDALVFKIAANLLRDRGRRGAISASAQLAEVDDHLVSVLTREFLEDRTPERVLLARVEIAEVFEALGELVQRKPARRNLDAPLGASQCLARAPDRDRSRELRGVRGLDGRRSGER
jgi:RNA polymerase sigma-70 factor (ECF subfamily)